MVICRRTGLRLSPSQLSRDDITSRFFWKTSRARAVCLLQPCQASKALLSCEQWPTRVRPVSFYCF
jgi:hypothetical protein